MNTTTDRNSRDRRSDSTPSGSQTNTDPTKQARPQVWNIKAGKYAARFYRHYFSSGGFVHLVFKLQVDNPEDVDFLTSAEFASRGCKDLEYFLADWFGKRVTLAEFIKQLSTDAASADLRAIIAIENKDWMGHDMPWIAIKGIEAFSEAEIVNKTAELVLPGEICVKANNRVKYNYNPPEGSYTAELTNVSEPSSDKIRFVFTMSEAPVLEKDKGSIYQAGISFFKPGRNGEEGRDTLLEFLSRWLAEEEMADCLAHADWSATFLSRLKRKKVIISIAPRGHGLSQPIKPIADIVNIQGFTEGISSRVTPVMSDQGSH